MTKSEKWNLLQFLTKEGVRFSPYDIIFFAKAQQPEGKRKRLKLAWYLQLERKNRMACAMCYLFHVKADGTLGEHVVVVPVSRLGTRHCVATYLNPEDESLADGQAWLNEYLVPLSGLVDHMRDQGLAGKPAKSGAAGSPD